MKRLLQGIAVCIVFCFSSCLQGDVVNGNFEFGGATEADSWIVSSGTIDRTMYGIFPHDVTPSPGGENWFIDLNGTNPGTIQTTIATVSGEDYELDFYLAAKPNVHQDGVPAPFDFRYEVTVEVGATERTYEFIELANDATQLTTEWQRQVIEFTAAGQSTTILFRSSDSPNAVHGALLDNVSVSGPVAVPEPASALLMLIAGLR